jgi:hypothetical protein
MLDQQLVEIERPVDIILGRRRKVVRLPVKLADLARELATSKDPGDVAAFLDVERRTALRVPMMAWSAACGFP